LPRVVAHQGEVAALGAEDLGERADVELGVVAACGGAGPQPVAAADGLVRRQVAGDRPSDAVAGGAAAAGRAQHPVEPFGVTQVKTRIGPIQPGDPGQRLARGGRETVLFVLPPPVGVEQDGGGVVEDAGELGELQSVCLGEPGDVVEVVLAGHGDGGARQRPRRQGLGPVGEPGQPGRVEAGGHRVLLARRVADSAAWSMRTVSSSWRVIASWPPRMARIAAPRIKCVRLPIMPPVR
jgi:hypothetical protein